MASNHKVTKVYDEDGKIVPNTYDYRGIQFYRNDSVAPGYWGRYQIIQYKKINAMRDQSTQLAVKTLIDNFLNAKDFSLTSF